MSGKPNLYICTDNFGISGVTTQSYYLARGMVAQGWQVHVICYSTAGNYYAPFQELGVQIHQVEPLNSTDFTKFYSFELTPTIDVSRKVLRYLKKRQVFDTKRPGVIVLNYMLTMFFLLDEIPENIARVLILHSDEPFYYNLLKHFQPHLEGVSAASAHISDQMTQLLREYVPSAIVPYGVDVPRQVEEYHLKIIYCGRLSEYQKRIFDTLEIAALLKRWGVSFQLTLVGDESNRAVLAQRIRHLEIRDRVKLMGPLNNDQLLEQFKQHHVFLQVSEFEGLSIALLQAIASGLIPVLSRVSSGATDIIEDGVNGFLIERGDITGFATVLKDLAAELSTSFNRLNRLRTAAVDSLVSKGCTAEAMVENYARFFDRVLAHNDANLSQRRMRSLDLNFPIETISPQHSLKTIAVEKPQLPPEREEILVEKPLYIREKPTLTFCLDGMHVGGVQTFVRHMARNLHRYGWNARVAIHDLNRQTPPVLQLERQGVSIVNYSYNADLRKMPQGIAQALQQDSAGVLVPNYINEIYGAIESLPPTLIPAYIFHADEAYYYETFQKYLAPLKAAVAVSQVCYDTADKMLKEQARSLPLTRIPYGVEMNTTWSDRPANSPLRIVYSGRIIEHQKCIFEIPELAALAKQQGLDCQWTLVGDGEDSELLQHRIRSLRVEDCVHLVGRASSGVIFNLLNEQDVFILTSEFEGLPLSLLEAMGHGCVPVVYDIPSGIHEVVRPEHNGFIIPNRQRDKLVAALAQLTQPERLNQLSHQAWQTVYPKYSIDQMVSQYANFFSEVLLNHVR